MTHPKHPFDPTRALFKADTADKARTLLDAGADVHAANEKGITALANATRKGRHEVVQVLLAAGARVDVVDQNGIPLAINASRSGNVSVMDVLLAAGMDLAARDANGATALMVATAPSMAEFLAGRGMDVHARDNEGFTALHYIARDSRFILSGAFGSVLQRGGQVDARSNDGRTPLMLCKQVRVLEELLEAGADATLVDDAGRNLLHHLAVFPYVLPRPTLLAILQSGVDPFQVDHLGRTPMRLFSDPASQAARVVGGPAVFHECVAQAQACLLEDATPDSAGLRRKPRL